MTVPDAALAGLLLTNRITPVGAKPLTAREFWKLAGRVDDLGRLLGATSRTVQADVGLAADLADRLATLLDAATAFALEHERLRSGGIELVCALDARYPARLRERLRDAAPPMLYVAGPLDWLATGGLGIVGSRAVDDAGAEVARGAAEEAVRLDRTVVSGAAKGVDRLAMGAALDAGGRVVGVTSEGLARAARSADTRAAVADGRLCLATPYAPDAGFTAGAAMGRNKIVYALADATLVVASDHDKGGTWTGAAEALDKGYGRVLVWRGAGEGPGNAALQQRGAEPLEQLADLATRLTPATDQPTGSGEQLGLAL